MAVTQTDIDALNAAIKNDAKQVVIDGQSVTYRSTDDLIRARNDLLEQLRQQSGARRPKRIALVYAGRRY